VCGHAVLIVDRPVLADGRRVSGGDRAGEFSVEAGNVGDLEDPIPLLADGTHRVYPNLSLGSSYGV